MATGAAPEGGAPPPRRLSEELADLHRCFAERPVTLREVIQTLRGRAYTLLLVVFALPFITPLPLPGLSTPFGLAIGFITLRLALGQKPWLPMKLQRKVLPAGFFTRVFAVTAHVIRFMEKFLRPRLPVITGSGRRLQLHALVMLVAAAALLLPLPIPFTNSFPAWAILLIAGGMLERDGWFILAGYAVFAAGVLYFVLLGGAAAQLLEMLHRWLPA